MFQKCPKCNYERKPGETEAPERCSACGLIFAKYLETQQRKPAPAPAAERAAERPWQNILGDLGLIKWTHLIAVVAHKLGLALMLSAYAWGAALL